MILIGSDWEQRSTGSHALKLSYRLFNFRWVHNLQGEHQSVRVWVKLFPVDCILMCHVTVSISFNFPLFFPWPSCSPVFHNLIALIIKFCAFFCVFTYVGFGVLLLSLFILSLAFGLLQDFDFFLLYSSCFVARLFWLPFYSGSQLYLINLMSCFGVVFWYTQQVVMLFSHKLSYNQTYLWNKGRSRFKSLPHWLDFPDPDALCIFYKSWFRLWAGATSTPHTMPLH